MKIGIDFDGTLIDSSCVKKEWIKRNLGLG